MRISEFLFVTTMTPDTLTSLLTSPSWESPEVVYLGFFFYPGWTLSICKDCASQLNFGQSLMRQCAIETGHNGFHPMNFQPIELCHNNVITRFEKVR